MNPMKCEFCGSNDFVKVEDFYICQHCSTKYTIEQAKHLVINGPVEIVMGDAEKERLLAPEEEPQFFAIVKKAFSQRRKTLVNSLVGYRTAPGAAPLQKEDILKALSACGIDEKRRPETLSIEEFAALSRAFQCS